MDSILGNYSPQKVFGYFEQICSIPHGSGNTKQLSDWIVSLARARELSCIQDETGNIIVCKDASPGYEDHEGLILQGHMDMVAVQTAESQLDLMKDSLKLAVDGDEIYAEGTSLGGDDGIAIAYMLTIMTDDTLSHPALELVFTTDEEIGLAGISKMDVSSLKGRKLLNLDTEMEGVLMAGCAGGIKAVCSLPVKYESVNGGCYRVRVLGLLGGHSGMEIHKERGNANLILARVLYELGSRHEIALANLHGGEKDNAIPKEAEALLVSKEPEEALRKELYILEEALRGELLGKDEGICLTLESVHADEAEWIKPGCGVSKADLDKICLCLLMNPNGVLAMSSALEDTVETSLNCGIMYLDEGEMRIRYALRSSIRSAKTYLLKRIVAFVTSLGGSVGTEGDYPPWEYQNESAFREQVMALYKRMYGKEMKMEVIHAGLECGYLSEQLEGLDCISIGPDMKHIHTTEETLSISSVRRVWEFLLEILKNQ